LAWLRALKPAPLDKETTEDAFRKVKNHGRHFFSTELKTGIKIHATCLWICKKLWMLAADIKAATSRKCSRSLKKKHDPEGRTKMMKSGDDG
jgi:hypothetical protein